jgi:hypothetical protein
MLTFPFGLRPFAGGFAPSVKSLSGGQSLSGFEQVASQLSDRWVASYAFAINSNAKVLAFRAFVTAMRGRANTVSLPAFDLARAPWAVDVYGRKVTPGMARNVKLDNTLYADQADLRQGLITAKVAADTDLCSTSLKVTIAKGSAPQAGHFFSVAQRLYTIHEALPSGSDYVLTIWPWLREAVFFGDAVNFAAPVCEMRFASDNEGVEALKGLAQLRFGTITLNFDEVPALTSVELREDGGLELRE